jgi:hypothetical protein
MMTSQDDAGTGWSYEQIDREDREYWNDKYDRDDEDDQGEDE